MAIQYAAKLASEKFCKEDDIESLLNLIEKTGHEGELVIEGLSDIIIKYSVESGDVILVQDTKDTGIKNFYSKDAFVRLTKPISDAICTKVKLDLLRKLYALNDPKISLIIKKNHFSEKEEMVK